MPSERFKRLPEEKQKKIRDACMAEYTRTNDRKSIAQPYDRRCRNLPGQFLYVF